MRRGEIWRANLDPIAGSEQAGHRYVLIVSADAFNDLMGRALIVPITTGGAFSRTRGFAIGLEEYGTKTKGFVLCDQLRTVDLKARHGRRREAVPDRLVAEVLSRLVTILS